MPDVLAYIDPGSGSLIFQAVVAVVVAIPFFFRTQIARVARAVRRSDDPERGQGSQPEQRH
ncbi:MAG: hypothetical protein ACJ77C_14610 [Chloroflexota bacterium]